MSKINPLFFALGIPVVVIVILVAIVAPRMGGGGNFADLTPFSVEAYRKDWATLQGNSYRLDCQVEQQLAFVEGRGRVLAVKPIEKDPTRPAGRIPIFVPAGSTDSFEVGQRFKCKLRVTRDLLVVEALERF
ncbi:hypothetical protein EMGBS6_16650 [Opitutia bacterium]|nr:hypothetical protein EMGBS6_16650 [Opitutae bacterium]